MSAMPLKGKLPSDPTEVYKRAVHANIDAKYSKYFAGEAIDGLNGWAVAYERYSAINLAHLWSPSHKIVTVDVFIHFLVSGQ